MSTPRKKSKTLFEESLFAIRDKYISDTDTKINTPLLKLRQSNTDKTLKLIDYENTVVQDLDKNFTSLKASYTYVHDIKVELEALLKKVERIEAVVEEIDHFTITGK
ncbi:hypothetical protein WICPIJ_001554 [Wickerhamomyces pijperi]|uniref:Uncharacterized protein n=1 Tax=Wickerhamomyces pijperi TaxID=599730 RepID=A0A9P8QDH6_WICPI|nr:hypothetical protein WICPIJ_001554 [Wickerhamomyces pijperi]